MKCRQNWSSNCENSLNEQIKTEYRASYKYHQIASFFYRDDVGLDKSIFDRYPAEISGGMKKRVAFARALYKNPKVIFLDEPTTGLDPINSDKINDLILKVITKRKVTAVTITHDIKSAIRTGDNYYFIHDGIIKDKGDCKKILKTKNKIFKAFIDGADFKY